VSVASACTISLFGTLRRSTSRPTGTIMAPPMPWKNRARTKPASESADAQASEPAMNTPMAARNTVRAPNRSAIQPDTGMKIARLTR
jgi:hypothetical protein